MTKTKFTSSLLFFRYAILPILTFSLIVGVIVGIIVNLYNYLAGVLVGLASDLYAFVATDPRYLPLLFLGLVLLALLVASLLHLTPECRGSGIPRTEGVLRGILTFRWLRVFLTTLINTSLAFFAGLSLGTEGPSIQMGAALAGGITSLPNQRSVWRRHVMTGGAAAGFAVAFNAPLTGIVFALEEVHRKFSPYLLFITALTVIAATTVSRLISTALGVDLTAFSVGVMTSIPLSNFWTLLLLGIAIGITASIFNVLITRSDRLLSRLNHCPNWLKLVTVFIITGVTAIWIPETIGSGHDLIILATGMNYSATETLILLIIKLFLITLCFNSGASGGLFLPMLTLGGLVGGLMGHSFVAMGVSAIYYSSFVIIGMSAFVGASTRAPITAMVLIVEITGQYNDFLMLGLAIIIACLIPHILRVQPLYESLLHKITSKEVPHEPPAYSF